MSKVWRSSVQGTPLLQCNMQCNGVDKTWNGVTVNFVKNIFAQNNAVTVLVAQAGSGQMV